MPDRKRRKKNPALLYREGPVLYDQDNDADYARRKKRKRSDRIYTVAMVFFALLFLASAGVLLKRLYEDRVSEKGFDDLESLITTAAEPGAADESGDTLTNEVKFAALKSRNEDFIGWLTVDGTSISYPVMHRPGGDNFYLRHGFDGAYSNYGVPYLDDACTLTDTERSTNLIVYGHHMKGGTIFGPLTGYRKADWFAQHPTIEFDTLYGDAEYEVFAAFAIDVVTDQSFPYNTYIDLDEDGFNAFVTEAKRRSDVDSGITPTYGDELLTLSTCEYSTSNGRFVVCARRVTDAA